MVAEQTSVHRLLRQARQFSCAHNSGSFVHQNIATFCVPVPGFAQWDTMIFGSAVWRTSTTSHATDPIPTYSKLYITPITSNHIFFVYHYFPVC